MKSSLNSERSSTHLNLFRGTFSDIAKSQYLIKYKLFTSQYLKYENPLFLL